MATRKKSPLKEMIDRSVADLQNAGFPSDPSLEENELTGPERFAKGQKQKDEVIIDSQLADIQGKEGYFLKLKKEMRPNEWMLMKTIESEWRNWPDIESEVARIVKEHTKSAPSKWGSGPYRIEYACKGGMRGKPYPTLDYYINAEEEFLNINGAHVGGVQPVADPTTQVTAQLDMLGRLTEIINSNKTPGLDVGQVQTQIAGAFEKGLAIKANEGNSSNQMMMTMMTGLMGMMTALATNKPVVEAPKVVNAKEELSGMLETLKTFGVLGNSNQEKPKSMIETLTELKAIGLDIFKKEDPMEQMSKLKQLANIAGEFMGMGGTGEKPGILEKIVDMVGPAIPGMIKDAKDAMGNAVQAQVEAGKNIERVKLSAPVNQPVVQPTNQGTTMQTPTVNNGNSVPVVNPQVVAFFNGLYDAVRGNNRLYYPIVYASLLSDPKGAELITGIINGSQTAKELIEMLQSYGDARFRDSDFVLKHLISYVNGYIIWLREMGKPKTFNEATQEVPPTNGFVAPKGAGYEVECMECHTVFVYENAQEFAEEDQKVCGNNGCQGVIQPLMKVS
jgi:hypothetical protein